MIADLYVKMETSISLILFSVPGIKFRTLYLPDTLMTLSCLSRPSPGFVAVLKTAKVTENA